MSEAGGARALASAGAAPAAGVRAPARARPAHAHRPRDGLVRRALALGDLSGVLAGAGAGVLLAAGRLEPKVLLVVAASLPLWLVLFRVYGLYERDVKRVRAPLLDDLPTLFHAFLIGTLGLGLGVGLADVGDLRPVDGVAFLICGVIGASALRTAARRVALRIGGPARILIAGSSPVAAELVSRIRAHPEYGLEPIGEVSFGPRGPESSGLPYLGRLDRIDLGALIASRDIDRVIVAARDVPEGPMMAVIATCGAAAAKVSIVPGHVNALGPSVAIDDVGGLTLLGLNPLVLSRSSQLLKRGLDVIGAAVAGVLLAPACAVIALAIKLDSPGPVLFRQRRIGRHGVPFTVLKFRTMEVDAERRAAELRELSEDPDWLKLERDPRVTRVGRFLRRTSLDELPQLWNVLRGSMSLVGPRPLIASEDERVAGWSRTRLDLAPGLTGLWQVLGRADLPFREMVALDYLYVTNWSLWLDLKLIARTIPAVLSRRGAN